MRSFIYAVLITAALAAVSIWYTYRLSHISDELSDMASQITTQLEADDYAAAAKLTDELEQEFLRLEPFFSTFGDHAETDTIERSIAELFVYTENGERTEALVRARLLCVMFDHLPKNSMVKPENIL